MNDALSDALGQYINGEMLPERYMNIVQQHLLTLANWIVEHKQRGKTVVVGISGAQGSGKSTITGVLELILAYKGFRVARLSIDDFYLSKKNRQLLAKDVHPLFITRGVPGTHDVALALKVFDELRYGGNEIRLPSFDKRVDDRVPDGMCPSAQAPADIVLFEGWCVGASAQDERELIEPLNRLEAEEDEDAIWRKRVNESLKSEYRQLFDMIDLLIFLRAPDFSCVQRWRSRQEQKTFAETGGEGAMRPKQMKRFIEHYERLTKACLDQLPAVANVILELDAEQQIVGSIYKSEV